MSASNVFATITTEGQEWQLPIYSEERYDEFEKEFDNLHFEIRHRGNQSKFSDADWKLITLWREEHKSAFEAEQRKRANARLLTPYDGDNPSQDALKLIELGDRLEAEGMDIRYVAGFTKPAHKTRARRVLVMDGEEVVGTVVPWHPKGYYSYSPKTPKGWKLEARKVNLRRYGAGRSSRKYSKLETAVKFMVENAVGKNQQDLDQERWNEVQRELDNKANAARRAVRDLITYDAYNVFDPDTDKALTAFIESREKLVELRAKADYASALALRFRRRFTLRYSSS